MPSNAVVFFDSRRKEVKMFPVGFFKDKEDSILELPEKVVSEKEKYSDYGSVLFYEGRNFELGISGEYQDYASAFKMYYEGAKQDHAGCCLKVAFYFLYGCGCGFKSESLFEIYLHKAVLLGSGLAKNFEYRWNGVDKISFYAGMDSCAFPVQSL